jgi:Protein of unknown function (DUF3105)
MSTGPRPQGPRKKGPQKKSNVKVPSVSSGGGSGSGSDNKRLLAIGGGAALILVAAVAAYFVFAGGSSASSDAPKMLEAAGCTVQAVKSLPSNDHSVLKPTGTSKKWNTDPPTSGPHYAVPLIWGAYTDPVNLGQLVHNLEHGGIYILYGNGVPASTVDKLRTFYDKHKEATILAPLPRLGNKVALGAWTSNSASQPNNGIARLVKCTNFDAKAFAAFFSAYQGKGPERFPMSSLLPGS